MTGEQNAGVPDGDDTVIVQGGDPGDAAADTDATVIIGAVADGRGEPDDTLLLDAPDEDDTVSLSNDAPDPLDDDPTLIVRDLTELAPDAEATRLITVADEPTVPVSRAGEATVEVPRAEPTLKVDRGVTDAATQRLNVAGSSPVKPVMVPPRKRRRGELRPAPVPSGFGGAPLVASGAGAVTTYRARALTPPPAALAAPAVAPAPSRVPGGVVSVRRRSRLGSIAAFAAAAVAFVLLAGGVVWAVKDLVGL